MNVRMVCNSDAYQKGCDAPRSQEHRSLVLGLDADPPRNPAHVTQPEFRRRNPTRPPNSFGSLSAQVGSLSSRIPDVRRQPADARTLREVAKYFRRGSTASDAVWATCDTCVAPDAARARSALYRPGHIARGYETIILWRSSTTNRCSSPYSLLSCS